MGKRHLDEVARLALERLQEELEETQANLKEAKSKEDKVKAQIIKMSSDYEFPEAENRSEIFNRLKVTYPEGSYGIDHKKFIELYGWDVFIQCFTITKAEMDVAAWTELVRNEEVVESGLKECIIEPRNLKPRVRLMKEGEDDDEEDD